MPLHADFFSKDYAEARSRFRAAAKAVNCELEAHAIDARGPSGEELTIDVAYCNGPGAPDRVIIVTSGLHGTEGLFGSAVQLAWLETIGKSWRPPAGIRLVMAHALNPYGFSWRRRWDENNVDLNRNFLVDRAFLANDTNYARTREIYARLDPFLNPPSPPSRLEPYLLKALMTILSAGWAVRRQAPPDLRTPFWNLRRHFALGLGELRKTLPVGQYEHPQGLFFGGQGPAQATRLVQSRLSKLVGSATFAIHIDFHTGLGRWADYKLLMDDGPDTEAARWAAARFGADVVEPVGGQTAYQAHGSIGQYFGLVLKGCSYRYLCAEFGTYSPLRVLGALRAENRAHQYGDPISQTFERTKHNLMETFCPASSAWRDAVLRKGLTILERAAAVAIGERSDDRVRAQSTPADFTP